MNCLPHRTHKPRERVSGLQHLHERQLRPELLPRPRSQIRAQNTVNSKIGQRPAERRRQLVYWDSNKRRYLVKQHGLYFCPQSGLLMLLLGQYLPQLRI